MAAALCPADQVGGSAVERFGVVLSDPPWAYDMKAPTAGHTRHHFNTMSTDALKEYQIVLADPPWSFETRSAAGKGRSPDQHYATMPDADIKAMAVLADPPWQGKAGHEGAPELHYPTLPTEQLAGLAVKDLCAKDCALFMWATYPKLPEALEVMAAWGFKYKTVAFTWVKLNPKSRTPFSGLGYWTRANCEICLLGTRGKPKRVANDVQQLIIAPRRQHSRKPDEQYERIERLMGDVPRLELFSRTRWDGWHTLGLDDGKFVPPAQQTTFVGWHEQRIESAS